MDENTIMEKSKEIFKDSYELVMMYYKYLHLGIFYSQLSKKENLSRKADNIELVFNTKKFSLRKDIIEKCLFDMYKKSNQNDFFDQLIRINSIRGITMALFEALKEEEIKQLFLNHIFQENEKHFDSFYGVLQFIRNTFSHNIRDRIKLEGKDYWKKSNINFSFDYSKRPFSITDKENYFKEINIDFNKIKDSGLYTDIISEYQTLLFIEFCHNCMQILENNHKK